MDILQAICDYGTLAGLKWQDENKEKPLNEIKKWMIQEWTIQKYIEDAFHRQLSLHVKSEDVYTKIAKKLGVDIDLNKEIGGHRADLVVYDQSGQMPEKIIELKIFADGNKIEDIKSDLEKANLFIDAVKSKVNVYVGVMVCQTKRDKLDVRISDLKDALGGRVLCLGPQVDVRGSWKWCFAAASRV